MVRVMKNFLLIILLFAAGSTSAQQLSVHGGGSMLLGFRSPGPWGGVHIGLEIPRDDAISIYGRFTHQFRALDNERYPVYLDTKQYDQFGNWVLAPGDVMIPQPTGAMSMDYNILEGGTRYYLGNGFDYGWAAYGGSAIMLVFNSVKLKDIDEYNEEYYEVNDSYRPDGSIFSLGFGLGGGVKFSSGRAGTFYFDLSLAYMIFGQGSSDYVGLDMYNPLIFNFNLGYRRDILW